MLAKYLKTIRILLAVLFYSHGIIFLDVTGIAANILGISCKMAVCSGLYYRLNIMVIIGLVV